MYHEYCGQPESDINNDFIVCKVLIYDRASTSHNNYSLKCGWKYSFTVVIISIILHACICTREVKLFCLQKKKSPVHSIQN